MTKIATKAQVRTLAIVAMMSFSACAPGTPEGGTPGESATPSASQGVAPPDLTGRIVFTRAGGPFGDETIFTANANGTGERQISEAGSACCPWVRRDGSRVLFSASAPDGRITTVTMNFDGSDRVLIPLPNDTLNLGPGPFSPDGQQIAFEGFDDADEARSGIYIGSADGANLAQITSEHGIPGDWSPDGTRLLFFRGPDGSPPPPGSLFVVDVNGTNEHQITPADMDVQCCGGYRWSPDGTHILFADADGALWLINPDGTNLSQLFVDPEGRFAITPTWSPDGSQIMFALDPTPDPFAHPVNGLYVIDADGSDLTLVIGGIDFKRNPYWVP